MINLAKGAGVVNNLLHKKLGFIPLFTILSIFTTASQFPNFLENPSRSAENKPIPSQKRQKLGISLPIFFFAQVWDIENVSNQQNSHPRKTGQSPGYALV